MQQLPVPLSVGSAADRRPSEHPSLCCGLHEGTRRGLSAFSRGRGFIRGPLLATTPHTHTRLFISTSPHSVTALSKDGEFAGNDAIVAFARCYGVNVVIHQLNAPRWEVIGSGGADGNTLHIAYLNGEHYCPVRPILAQQNLPCVVSRRYSQLALYSVVSSECCVAVYRLAFPKGHRPRRPQGG